MLGSVRETQKRRWNWVMVRRSVVRATGGPKAERTRRVRKRKDVQARVANTSRTE